MADDKETTELFAYYDTRADGYEDFYDGKGAAIAPLANEYPVDTAGVAALLSSFGRGEVIDLACGTGFWLSVYGPHCRSATLVDQSPVSLSRCRRRVHDLGLETVARIVEGDLFHVPLPAAAYDACLLGFLLSHLTTELIDVLFQRLRIVLRQDAELAVIDSGWSAARQPYCARDGFERRGLPDGRAFSIRKKYYDRPELETLLMYHGFVPRSVYTGHVFIAMLAARAR